MFGLPPLRQVGVLYGHHGSGKVYNYLAKDTIRTGDLVTPEVTHYISGTTYRTLGRVVSTRNAEGVPAYATEEYLAKQGIELKKIGATDQRSLPNYYEGWGKDADKRYEEAKMRRINMFGD